MNSPILNHQIATLWTILNFFLIAIFFSSENAATPLGGWLNSNIDHPYCLGILDKKKRLAYSYCWKKRIHIRPKVHFTYVKQLKVSVLKSNRGV